jgi:hypothetical protein
MSFTTLVDAATLAAHLDDPDWLIIDVRHQLADTAYGARVYMPKDTFPVRFSCTATATCQGRPPVRMVDIPCLIRKNWPGGSVKSAWGHKRKSSFMTTPNP